MDPIALSEMPAAETLEALQMARVAYGGGQAAELLQLWRFLEERDDRHLWPENREAVLDLLCEWPTQTTLVLDDMEDAADPTTQRAVLQVRRAMNPPDDHPDLPSPRTAAIGRDMLADYPAIVRSELATADILVTEVTARQGDPFTAEVLACMSRIREHGGVVLISSPDARPWPDSLQAWARQQALDLPGGHTAVVGVGLPAVADYRSIADQPWSPSEQRGLPARGAWKTWPGSAPIRTRDGQGALLVVAPLGKGTVIFTPVDLIARPLYRDNVLHWIYGSRLLGDQGHPMPDRSLAVTGQTPHTPWLKPTAGEPISVLYLTDRRLRRGMLELHQRLDLDYRYVPYEARIAGPEIASITPAYASLYAIAAVADALPWASVLLADSAEVNLSRSISREVRGTVGIDLLPRRLRRQIWAAVHERGLGLMVAAEPRVMLHMPDLASRLQTADSWSHRMPFLGDEDCRVQASGAGRVAWLARRLEHLDFSASPYEPDVLGDEWLVPGLEQPRAHLRVAEYAYAAQARLLRYTAGQDSPVRDVTVADGQLSAAFALPLHGRLEVSLVDRYGRRRQLPPMQLDGSRGDVVLPAGTSDARLVEWRLCAADGRVIDAGATLRPQANPSPIVDIETDARWYSPGDVIAVRVRLAPDAVGDITIEVRDTWGRVVHRSVGPDTTVRVAQPMARLWDIEATLHHADGRAIAYRRQPVGIVLPRRTRDFRVAATLRRPHALLPLLRDQMGMSVAYGDAETAFRANLELSAGIWNDPVGISPTPGARLVPHERTPCLSASSFRLQALRDMRAAGPRWARTGVTDYMIDDECVLGPRCQSPASLARFRLWLRAEYADLTALNREWASSFSQWDDVVPLVGSTAARPGPHVDFERFRTWEFAEYASYLQLLADDHVPGIKIGHSGGRRDPQMMHLANALWYYGVDEAAVAAKRPDALIGSWFEPGYRFREDHEVESRRWAWWHLLRGTTRVELWYPTDVAPAIHGDLSRPYAAFSWLHEEMRDLHRGMGMLLLNADRDEGRVAVYASMRAGLTRQVLAEITGSPVATSARAASFQRAVLAASVECRYINEYQVESGALADRGVRLLYLADADSLSARERGQLAAYVAGGGVLLADRLPGTRNAHGTVVGEDWARDLFSAPNAILLPAASTAFTPAQITELLAMADITPRLLVADDAGTPQSVDRGVFIDGDAVYAGFVEAASGMVADHAVRSISVQFDRAGHLYDSRAGRYLGEVDGVATTLQPGVAHLYALLPWRLNAITADATSAVPGDVATVSVRATAEGEVGRQVWWIRFAAPDGSWHPAYDQRIVVTGGRAEVALPIHLDAAIGTWRLVIRDAATGILGETTVEVQP